MESPSGRACEVSRKRCLRVISSQIWRMGVVAVATDSLIIVARLGHLVARSLRGARLAGPLGVELLEDLLDTVSFLDRFVEKEAELRNALQSQPLAHLSSQKRRRTG